MRATVIDREAEEVDAAAQLALVGIDPLSFLEETDPLKVAVLQAIADRVRELRAEERALEREHLATLIRNEIAEMLS